MSPPASLSSRFIIGTLLLLASAAPSASFAVEPLRVVGTGGRIAPASYTVTGASTSFWQRTPHKLGGPVAELDIGFMNWVHTSKVEAANTNIVTIDRAWLERASTGQVVPLTFSGRRQLVMAANATTAFYLADPVPSSAWNATDPLPARDEVFWVHAKGVIPAGGQIYLGTPATFSGAKFMVYDPANDPGTSDVAGAVPAIAGSLARSSALPMLFLGRFTGPGHLSVIGIGDSILDGSGDSSNPVPVISGFGFFNRAALDENGANAIAMMNLSRHAEAAANWVGSHSRQDQLLRFANVVVEEFGTNDIGGDAGSDGGSSKVAPIYNRLESIWTTARAFGVQKIVRTQLMPRTISASTNWTSLADQTPNRGWGAGEARDQINALFATALASGKIDVFVNTLSLVGDPVDDHRWLTNGTNDYMTSDGAHLRPAANILLAPPLRAALLSLTVDENPAGYTAWASAIDWSGADADPDADPNGDGVNNLLAYSLDLSPLAPAAATDLPSTGVDTVTTGGPWSTFSYRCRSSSVDLTYRVHTSGDLVTWTDVDIDGVNAVAEIANPDPDGDGSAVLRRVRVKLTSGVTCHFHRLRVIR